MREVEEFVAGALSLPTSHEDVKVCLDVLRGELVRDMDTLKEVWDVLKDRMPALARSRINKLLIKPYVVDKVTEVSPTVWLKNALICAVLFAIPCIVGVLSWDEKLSENPFDSSLGLTVWLPLGVLFVVEVALGSLMAPKIGWDMIADASEDADLREALKNSMTTQGFISALFLTVVWAMLQAEAIQGDTTLIISQWYTGLLSASITLTLIGVMASVTCLLFLEPLTGDAALDCVYNNFMYFGEPLALSGFAFVNSMFATILWIFGTYGLGLGVFSTVCFFYGALRSLVIYDYMVSWKNPQIAGFIRDSRMNIKKMIATTGGKDALTAVKPGRGVSM